MNDHTCNYGIVTGVGKTVVNQPAIGPGATVNITSSATRGRTAARERDERWDVGVITVLSVETHAVQHALELTPKKAGGLHFHVGKLTTDDRSAKVVATRTLSQGQRSTMAAFGHLRRHYDPKVVVLVGIGGGIHADVLLGDVVVATRVVYYDLRKEKITGTQHRGEEKEAPVEIGHAVNCFFTDNGEPAEFREEGPGNAVRSFRVRTGPIGSGDAVIADRDSEILKYLAQFNDRILAVDMESGGLSQACHEQSVMSGRLQGWAVVRGISDDASHRKNDDYHRIAAWHAAVVLRRLIPYLLVGVPDPATP
ncbi:MAG: hypothetical protein ACRDRI_25995 [Pseudonocardiaceae bacterium]